MNSVEIVAEARYRHQIWEIDVPIPFRRFDDAGHVARVREAFHRAHQEIFGFGDPDSAVEFVGWRATARCRLRGTGLGRLAREKEHRTKLASSRKAYFSDTGLVDARIELFETLPPDRRLKGPAIIESPFTTVVVDPGAEVVRKPSGSLVIVP